MTERICPNCRKALPPDVPLGLCPECLIKSGFPTGTDPGAAARERFMPPSVEEIVSLFPQFEILAFIGKGGMGAVYKARQPALDRFIALKVLPPAVASDPGFAERFNREARALARLSHPNIVVVYDFGKAGALHYLAMEFVDGTNLREVERAGKLSPEQALAIVPQICEALQFAHNEGIVHRDIKPENLLLDKKGRLKITDFGIAKILDTKTDKASLTGARDVVGTPHYMAPEQIEKPQTVDHRADIYSLGVVFYEMLTGELPLGKFAPPSKKAPVDARLDDVVMHTLEKEPEQRYQQASQVKTDVETIAASATPPIIVLPTGIAFEKKQTLPANRKWPMIFGITGTATLLLLFVFNHHANSSPEMQELQKELNQADANLAHEEALFKKGKATDLDLKTAKDQKEYLEAERLVTLNTPGFRDGSVSFEAYKHELLNVLSAKRQLDRDEAQKTNSQMAAASDTAPLSSAGTATPPSADASVQISTSNVVNGNLKLYARSDAVQMAAASDPSQPVDPATNLRLDKTHVQSNEAGMQNTNLPLEMVVGNTATFTVAAAGATPLSYQWEFNGTNSPQTTMASNTASFTVTAGGTPPGYQWYKNGSNATVEEQGQTNTSNSSNPNGAWNLYVQDSSSTSSAQSGGNTNESWNLNIQDSASNAQLGGDSTQRVDVGDARDFSKSFTVGPEGKLTMNVDRGNIQITAADQDTIEIRVEREVTHASDSDAAEILKEEHVVLAQSGNQISITSQDPSRLHRSSFFGSNVNVDAHYEITVPRRFDAQAKTAGGNITVTGIQGGATIRTMGGNLDCENINGNVEGHTDGGNVSANGCKGRLQLKTSGGNMTIGGFAGPGIQANTDGGTMYAEFAVAPTSDSQLHTAGGSISIKLPENAALALDAHTDGGVVRTDFPVEVEGVISGDTLKGTINGGGPKLDLKTDGGNILILKQ